MGWQGRMRDAKGRRYWNMLSEPERINRKFLVAKAWRSDVHVWIWFRDNKDQEHVIRVARKTGKVDKWERAYSANRDLRHRLAWKKNQERIANE